MTVEQQRYLEECKKVLDKEQAAIVGMALDYGLPMPEIRKVVQSNKNAGCMKEAVSGMMEGIDGEALDFLCENDFNQYQIQEVVKGIVNGLPLEQVKAYAALEIPASRMKQMRSRLEEAQRPKAGQENGEDGIRDYMKGLMEVMETSLKQFQESNERFDALSSLVKEHVVDEKNREIQDLYENLRYKDKTVQDLQKKLEDREKKITELEAQMGEQRKRKEAYGENQEAGKQEQPHPLKEKQEQPHSLKEKRAHSFKVQPEGIAGVHRRGSKPGEADERVPHFPVEMKTGGGRNLLDMHEAEDHRLKKRMTSWLASWNRGKRRDIFGMIKEADLSPQQLEEVRKCLECSLTDEEIGSLIENAPSPEKIRKMREILLLMRKRKGGC